MAIDKKLFPNAQRAIPDMWNKFKITLKHNPSYMVPWKQVERLAKQDEMKLEDLQDCLQYLSDTGEILWCRDTPALAKTVFHKPRVLIRLLASMFRHDVDEFLSYKENKVFLSKGQFSEEDFFKARELFLRNGQISRPLMNCFWFFEELDYEQFNDMLDLAPTMDICYSIPEPGMPQGLLYSYPIMVLPWYNQERAGSDLTVHWNDALTTVNNPCTMSLKYKLPLGVPAGLFEKILATLQVHVITRIDWRDAILGTTSKELFKLAVVTSIKSTEESNPTDIPLSDITPAHMGLTIVTEKNNESGAMSLLKELTREITDIVSRTEGLVWRLEADDNMWSTSSLQFAPKVVQFNK